MLKAMITFQEVFNQFKSKDPKLFSSFDDLMDSSTISDEKIHYSEAYVLYCLVKFGEVELGSPQGDGELIKFCHDYFETSDIPKENTILRSFILKEILLRSDTIFKNRIRNISIKGAKITANELDNSQIDLSSVICNFLLTFDNCAFAELLNIKNSVFGSLTITDCDFRYSSQSNCLDGQGLLVSESLKLLRNRYHRKNIELADVKVCGSFLFDNEKPGLEEAEYFIARINLIGLNCYKDVNIIRATFDTSEEQQYGINIQRSEIGGNFSIRYISNSEEYVDFLHIQNTRVNRNFIVINCNIAGIENCILSSGSFYNAVIMNDEKPSNFHGKLDFCYSNIHSDFDLTHVNLIANEGHNALELNESMIGGSLRLNGTEELPYSFTCFGCIEMNYIKVGNQVNFSLSKVITNGQYAIRCKSGRIEGRITFSPEFNVDHQFHTQKSERSPAHIRGKISFVGTTCKDLDLSDLDVSITESSFAQCAEYFPEGKLSSTKLQRNSHLLKNSVLYDITSLDLKHIRVMENLFLNEGPVQGWYFLNNGIIDARDSIIGRLNISSSKLSGETTFFRVSGMQYESIIDESKRTNRISIIKLINSWWMRPKQNVEECGWFRFVFTKDNLYQPYEQLSRALNNVGDHPKSRFVRFVGFQVFNPIKYSKSILPVLPEKFGYFFGHLIRTIKFIFISLVFIIYETGIPAYRSILCILLILFIGSISPEFANDGEMLAVFSFDSFKSTIKLLLPFFEMDSDGTTGRPFLRVFGIIYIALFVVDISQLNKRGRA